MTSSPHPPPEQAALFRRPSKNLLHNDSDPDTGDQLTVTGISLHGAGSFQTVAAGGTDITDADGTLHVNTDGTYAYTLNAVGQAAALALPAGGPLPNRAFDYQITDDQGATAQAKLTISVTGVNDERAGTDHAIVENTRVKLTDASTGSAFGGTQVDSDGSETLSFKFGSAANRMPVGATLVDVNGTAIGTDNHDGTWSLTAAQYNAAYFKFPTNLAGDFKLDFTTITQEQA